MESFDGAIKTVILQQLNHHKDSNEGERRMRRCVRKYRFGLKHECSRKLHRRLLHINDASGRKQEECLRKHGRYLGKMYLPHIDSPLEVISTGSESVKAFSSDASFISNYMGFLGGLVGWAID